MILHGQMDAHTRAILAQMSTEERKFYEFEPQRSWLAQMRRQLQRMTVADGAKMLRENMAAFRKAKAPTPSTDREATPGSTTAVAPLLTR